MTKTITTDWKSGSRRVELQYPGDATVNEHTSLAPKPFKMSPRSFVWMHTTIELGSELEEDTINEMYFSDGLNLLSEVLGYWSDRRGGDEEETTDNGGGETLEFDGIELNEDGAVDLEDME